jgi:hypothetical protein
MTVLVIIGTGEEIAAAGTLQLAGVAEQLGGAVGAVLDGKIGRGGRGSRGCRGGRGNGVFRPFGLCHGKRELYRSQDSVVSRQAKTKTQGKKQEQSRSLVAETIPQRGINSLLGRTQREMRRVGGE